MGNLVIIERANGNIVASHPVSSGLNLTAQPGHVYSLVDAATEQTPKDMLLKRQGDELIIEANGEVVAKIDGFYADGATSQFSTDGGVSGNLIAGGSEAAAEGVVWQATDMGAAMVAGGSVLAGAAAVAGSGSSSSVVAATVADVVSGTIVAGPVIDGHGLSVTVYDNEGNEIGTGTVNSDGTFSVDIDNGYSGIALVRVVDSNAAADYYDEGSGAPKDLTTDLRAVTTVDGSGTYTMNVNILTELAVREMGLSGGDGGTSEIDLSSLTEADVQTANDNVAAAFGLDGVDLVAGSAIPVINQDGSANSEANDYGAVLAAISGVETNESKDTDTVLNELAAGLNGSVLDDAQKQQLVDAAPEGQTTSDLLGNLLDYTPPQEPEPEPEPEPEDTTAPTLVSSSPADDATDVALDSNIVLTFSEDIQLGSSGLIRVSQGGDTEFTIDVSDHNGQLSVSGNTLTINPTNDLKMHH